MKLDFGQLTITNFKGFVNNSHHFSLKQIGPGLYFVRGYNELEPRLGSNGAGKSSIWDALCWCLYGRTPDGLRNPDVRPWFCEGSTAVTVEISDHLITRTIVPNLLQLDDREVGQEQIDELMGMPYDVFTNTILLGQGEDLFFDLKPQKKMELFSTVLGLERWDERAAGAREEVHKLEKEAAGLEGELLGIKARIEQAEAQLKTVTELGKEWEAARSARKTTAEKELKELDASIAVLQSAVDAADLAYDSATAELRGLEQNADRLEQRAQELTRKSGEFTAQRNHAKRELEELEQELEELGTGSTCRTCGQSLKGTALEKHRKTLAKRIKEQSEIANTPSPKILTQAIAKLDQELKQWEKSRGQFREKAEHAQDVLTSQKGQLLAQSAKASSIRAGLVEGDREANPHATQRNQLQRLLSGLQDELQGAEDYNAWLARKIARTLFWVKGFKDVRYYVMNDVLHELELVTNSMLADAGLVNWHIKYAVERETQKGTMQQGLTVTVLSPDLEQPVKWESWSGGEAQRLRLVGALALSEVLLSHAGVEPSIEILDEPSQHLSVEGVRDMCDYLAARAASQERVIFFVDHMSVESSQFKGVITVVKDKEGSRIDVTE